MVYKRPFGDEDTFEVAFNKHPRRSDFSNQLPSFGETIPWNDIPWKPQSSVGEGEAEFSKAQACERLVNRSTTDQCTVADKEDETTAHPSMSGSAWVSCGTSEENYRSETGARLSFSPDYASRVVLQPDEIYSSLVDHPLRKSVPVGPGHQAAIPAWGISGVKKASSYLDAISPKQPSSSDVLIDEGEWEKLMGTCIVPAQDSEQSSYSGNEFGSGRVDCSCPDGGSVRCVRQHVKEARERLKETLGWEKFVELGFGDMGEEVAQKWSEEEERIFHQVVFSNPASLCKNFWDYLPEIFPSRTKKELVSYYFNVFMLRKRAEQNRTIPLNVDSDNDEWEETDDGEEFGTIEDYEDSAVESLVDQEDPGYKQEDREEYFDDNDDEDVDDFYDNDDNYNLDGDGGPASEEDEGGVENVSEACNEKLPDGCGFKPAAKLGATQPGEGGEDHDVQNDSCTSYECQHSGGDSYGPVDAGVIVQENQAESGSNKGSQSTYGYCLDPCDAKVWDIGYLTGPKNECDLLPTCSMIEEVFGEEAWNNKGGKDSKRTS